MKHSFIKTVALVLCLTVFCSLMPVGSLVFAASDKKTNADFSIPFSIQERKGIEVKDYFFRRGIAIEKGLLYSHENICLMENGKPITSAAETLEKHDDGSIHWLLISGNVDLKPNEYKTLSITNGSSTQSQTCIETEEGYIKVYSPKINMILGPGGVESLQYNGKEMLKDGNINVYAALGGKTYYLEATEISVLKHTNAYSKFKLRGRLSGNLVGEMYITLAEGASKLQIDHLITAEDYCDIESTGLKIDIKSPYHKTGDIIDKDFLELGNIEFSTYDNTRFNGATNEKEMTGYIIDDNAIRFAPIVNGKPYTYVDGVSRTAHLYVCFEKDAQEWATMLTLPPSPKTTPKQYVKAGDILTDVVSPVVNDFISTIKEGYKRSYGQFEAGHITGYNPIAKTVQNPVNIPGEIEFNYGKAYMQTGDEELYRQMCELSEIRSDILVYRGMHKDSTGIMRARSKYTVATASSFNMSHGYYSDEGGLYMAYVLTGDERTLDSLKLCLNRTMKDMYARPAVGSYNATYTYFGTPSDPYKKPSNSQFVESRGLIRARTYYLASRLFEDQRLYEAAYDVVKMANNMLFDDGGLSQIFNLDGKPNYQTIPEGYRRQLPRKHYVNLMGFRGISEMLDYEEDPLTLDTVKRQADFLCNIGEKFGPVLMDPNSDIDLYEVNENGSRGVDSRANLMAVDVICSAYEHTGDEKYLKWILKYMEAFIASSVSGLGCTSGAKGYGAVANWDYELLRNVSILRTSDNLSKIFEDNREKIEAMGYEHMSLIFSEGTKSLGGQYGDAEVGYPYTTRTVYENDGTKVILTMNHRTPDAKEDDESWGQYVSVTFDENKLWEGCTNLISSPFEVTLNEWLEYLEFYWGLQRPIYVEEFSGSSTANINAYTKEKIELTMAGDFEATLRIEDGQFEISDDKGYTITNEFKNGKVYITVINGGNVYPKNGELRIKVNGKGESLENVGLNLFEGTCLEGISAGEKLTKEQLTKFVSERYGYEIDLGNKAATWNNFSNELVAAVSASGSKALTAAGLHVLNERVENKAVTDEEAVNYAAEKLEVLYNGNTLSSDVYLSDKGLHNTKVTWKSSREDILSTKGVLDRQAIDCDTVTLTATITRGSAVKTKDIVIPLDRSSKSSIDGYAGFNKNINMDGLVPQTDEFELIITGRVVKPNVETILILGSSKEEMTSHLDWPFGVRIGTKIIEGYNGTSYSYETPLPGAQGKYKFRFVVRPKTMTHDVYVTYEDGEEMVLSKNYYKRGTAPDLDVVDQFWLWEGVPDAFEIDEISLLKLKKTNAVDVYIEDAEGKKFAPYDSLDNYVYPTITEDGKYINWKTIKSSVKRYGEYMNVHIGIEKTGVEQNSLMDMLRDTRLIPDYVKDTDYVTPASLVRIISVK